MNEWNISWFYFCKIGVNAACDPVPLIYSLLIYDLLE